MSKFGRLRRSANGTATCCDCGMNTMPSGKPKPRTFEQFICKDEVWAAAGMTPGKISPNHELVGGGFLCVGCIETRLGRRLTIDDFKPIVISLLFEPWPTERLRSRALYRTQAEEDAAKLAEPPKWVAEFAPEGLAMAMTIEVPQHETMCGRPMQQEGADTLLKNERNAAVMR
jgi:hypothetical protein